MHLDKTVKAGLNSSSSMQNCVNNIKSWVGESGGYHKGTGTADLLAVAGALFILHIATMEGIQIYGADS